MKILKIIAVVLAIGGLSINIHGVRENDNRMEIVGTACIIVGLVISLLRPM